MIREERSQELRGPDAAFEAPYYERCMLVTDDKHPGDLIPWTY